MVARPCLRLGREGCVSPGVTQEITAMIQTVQQETSAAVADMQAGTKQVEVGVEITYKSGA